ncbi:MAG: bifunctional phosphopantothenoylcysteine decarboxylase/phosphopantothenate--cysteine ligase CoaBC [Crocinitomicaceae bacterium]|nr:bifunctional phosphopantothenoylcysteine decarboxylase/phosphopantothenate--cysteine ligase CoaBC [Crocinitomicaceae bacterium]
MKGKRILLGITGGIAAYKIAFLIRLIKKKEAEVRCIMTPASCDFISPLTIATLSENPVLIDFWNQKDGTWSNHVELGAWADVFLIAPLTANTMAKLVHGQSDNLLTATYLSATCPVMIAPAMDLDMYAHPATLRNIAQLESDHVHVIPAEFGELASGLVGKGRMAEPEHIVDHLIHFFKQDSLFEGTTVLITAGPTYEKLDPVRFIGNHSSGKMGFNIADQFLKQGAQVILVTGPTKETLHHPNLKRFDVESAQEMLELVQKYWKQCQIGVFSAAVSDYRPAEKADQKIKKSDDELILRLIKNPDILAWAGENKSKDQVLMGFALETNRAEEHAKGKLKKKNLDFIVVNTLEDQGAGFGVDTNRIKIIDKNNNLTSFELKSKREVAQDIVQYLNESI